MLTKPSSFKSAGGVGKYPKPDTISDNKSKSAIVIALSKFISPKL